MRGSFEHRPDVILCGLYLTPGNKHLYQVLGREQLVPAVVARIRGIIEHVGDLDTQVPIERGSDELLLRDLFIARVHADNLAPGVDPLALVAKDFGGHETFAGGHLVHRVCEVFHFRNGAKMRAKLAVVNRILKLPSPL